MATRFRKSVSLGKGAKLNIGKKSVGVSLGGKHGGVSLNSKTGTRARVSAPGTGLSYSQKLGGGSDKSVSTSSSFNPSTSGGNKTHKFAKALSYIVGSLCAVVALLMLLISSYGACIVMALFAVLMFYLGKNYSKQQKQAAAEKQAAIDGVVAEVKRTHSFNVVGVTFTNDDGESRQNVLKDASGQLFYDSALRISEYNGKPAVQVLIDNKVCGYISKDKVSEVVELMSRSENVKIFIDNFVDEKGITVYTAVVHLITKADAVEM